MTKEMEERLVRECREWIGTKWAHGVALKGYKTDCVQFIVAVYQRLGLLDPAFRTRKYARDWALHNSESALLAELEKHAVKVGLKEFRIGDIVVFRYGRCASHAAVYIGEGRIVHAVIRKGVIESPLSEYAARMHSAWRLTWRT